jgi:hypothetical protein
MALQQFNEWEPRLDPVNGVQAQEPRVFAHDAHPVVVGAINDSDANHGLSVTNFGNGGANPYVVGDTITLTTPTAGVVGDRAVITVTAVDADGVITNFDVTTVGQLYVVGDTANQVLTTSAAGTGFAATVSNIDIPNTQKRGACVYIGAAGGLSITVVMESGTEVSFNNISEGSILPILIKRVTSALTANDLIALY